MRPKYQLKTLDGEDYYIPETEDVSILSEVAKSISKGSERFPSRPMMIMVQEDADGYVDNRVHSIYLNGDAYVREE